MQNLGPHNSSINISHPLRLKSSKGAGYKALARHTTFKTCNPKDFICTYVAVDVRSRLFRYVREMSIIRSTKRKIRCVFGLLLRGTMLEIEQVCNEALQQMMAEASLLGAKKIQYVLCSPERCQYRERLRLLDRTLEKTKATDRLITALRKCRKHILDVSVMLKCHDAFVSYVIAHIEEACLVYNRAEGYCKAYGKATSMPGQEDSYESDRLCARFYAEEPMGTSLFANKKTHYCSAVLSEDYDCIFLFGANKMIKKVTNNAVQYVTIQDAMKVFECNDRKSLAYKCCLMGTDYNLGLRGIGPKKAAKINNELVLVEECMRQQCIDIQDLMEFFLIL